MIGIGAGVGLSRPRGLERAVQAIFANGEQGLWLDFFDTATIFQDSAGTVPVTSDGDLYGYVADKSGNGNDATQATTGAKPTAGLNAAGKLVAVYDGFDDFMATAAAINFTGTDAVTVFAAVRKNSDTTQGVICELGPSIGTTTGSFILSTYPTSSWRFASKGSLLSENIVSGHAAPESAVLIGSADISAHTNIISINGINTSVATDQGLGNFLNGIIYIGMRAGSSLPANIELSSLIVVGRQCTSDEKSAVSAYQAAGMGLVL